MGNLPAPSTNNLPLIPDPTKPTSSYYVFPSRPYGSLRSTAQLSYSAPTNPSVGPQSGIDHKYRGLLYGDSDELDLATVMGEHSWLEWELQQDHHWEAEQGVVISKL